MHRLYGALALATTLVASGAMAQNVAVSDLDVRSGPGAAYPINGVIAAGEVVAVQGCVAPANWCEVSGAGIQGWVHGGYIAAAQPVVPVVPVAPVPGQHVVTTTTTMEPVVDGQKVEENAAVGGLGGVAMGAIVGGPVGAIAGAIIGGVAGAASVEPTVEMTTYVTTATVEPIFLDGTVAVGAGIPQAVPLYEVPSAPDTRFARINNQVVLVDPATRQIVYVYR